jgi:hypothetical protein
VNYLLLNEKKKNMILFMKMLISCIFCFFGVACTPSASPQMASDAKKNEISPPKANTNSVLAKSSSVSKVLREAIYFSNSLEREALKLILKDPSLQKQTLFSVLSFIMETESGAKKSTPHGLDCGKYEVRKEERILRVFKTCVRPNIEVAIITTVEDEKEYKVDFMIHEWPDVVGLSVALTAPNVSCHLRLADKKLYSLVCENWSYLISEDQISSTVLKANEFHFQRDAEKQFVIKGGFYKELVENKKIDIIIPLEGKIKIIEKELQVIDEFLDKKEDINAKKEELKKSNSQSQDQSQAQSGDQSAQSLEQERNQEQGQDQSQEPNQIQNQDGQQVPQEDNQPQQPVKPPEEGTRGRRGR